MSWEFDELPFETSLEESDKDSTTSAELKAIRSTRIGVAELLMKYKAEQLCHLLRRRYDCDYKDISDIPRFIRIRDADELEEILLEVAKRAAEMSSSVGKIGDLIEFSRTEIKQFSVSLAEMEYPSQCAKITAAEDLLGSDIPGTTSESRYARTCDASFWRRMLMALVNRTKEHFFLRLGMLGAKTEKYASDFGVSEREKQIRAQQKWIEETVLLLDADNGADRDQDRIEIRLADIVKGPEERFAKLYSFVKAVDLLSVESKLSAAMLTITLEPEWHPNPSKGSKKWNGKSPREAHKSFCKRWQAICRDLHRTGVRISGLRVAEPHADACPHYHTWLLYRPEHEAKILLAVMRYFPLKLKIRSPESDTSTSKDVIYKSRADLASGICVPFQNAGEGAQVEFSRIDRKLSSGASYVMKYLIKTLPSGSRDKFKANKGQEEGDLSPALSMSRIDAYRAIWGINQGQLFGVAKCLTAWDQFRRMQQPPDHAHLRALWTMARGGVTEGRIEKCAGQRGDTYGFLKALGGLDAARNGKRNGNRLVLARLVEEGTNRFGDLIKRTTGIRLLRKERRKIEKENCKNGSTKTVWKTFTEVVVSVRTKVEGWTFKTRKSNSFNIVLKSPIPC